MINTLERQHDSVSMRMPSATSRHATQDALLHAPCAIFGKQICYGHGNDCATTGFKATESGCGTTVYLPVLPTPQARPTYPVVSGVPGCGRSGCVDGAHVLPLVLCVRSPIALCHNAFHACRNRYCDNDIEQGHPSRKAYPLRVWVKVSVTGLTCTTPVTHNHLLYHPLYCQGSDLRRCNASKHSMTVSSALTSTNGGGSDSQLTTVRPLLGIGFFRRPQTRRLRSCLRRSEALFDHTESCCATMTFDRGSRYQISMCYRVSGTTSQEGGMSL